MQIIPKPFHVETINFVETLGDLWVPGEQIGRALGYKNPRKAIKDIYLRNKNELDEHSCLLNIPRIKEGAQSAPPFQFLDYKGGAQSEPPFVNAQEVRVYNEHGVMLLTMLSSQPKAAEFRKWAVGIITKYRNGKIKFTSELTVAEAEAILQEAKRRKLHQDLGIGDLFGSFYH